jgi:serine/threonine-protein kinase RsbW
MTAASPEPEGSAPELSIEFPRKPEYVRTVRQAVAALARLHGADEAVVEDIKLAVSEACNTALSPVGEPYASAVELMAWGGPEGLVVDVLDAEATFDHAVAGPPEEISTEDLPFERALALPIIRGLATQVAIEPRAGGGAVTRMVLSLEVGERG